MSASITDRVRRLREDLEAGERLDDRGVLEHKYELLEDGSINEVTVVLTVGGPLLEVECLRGVVVGHWGGESHRLGVDADHVTQYGRRVADRMEARIDS
jgi:hypothetical protein